MPENQFLNTNIKFLKTVGDKRAEILKKQLGIFTFGDLLQHYPFRYVDRTKFYKISEINDDAAYIQIKGKISRVQQLGEKRAKRLVVSFTDGINTIELIWFQGIKWTLDKLNLDLEYIAFGKPTEYNGKYNLAHPELIPLVEFQNAGNTHFQGIYNSSESLKALGLDSNGIRKLIQLVLQHNAFSIQESMPMHLLTQINLMPKDIAVKQIHSPERLDIMQKAQYRLKFEELFFLQAKLLRNKHLRIQSTPGIIFHKVGDLFNEFYKSCLPFELTNAQKRVIKEIRQDFARGKQMNRLVQGDVGSGKTIVALMCMLLAVDNSYQAALMAPTEILAQQHFESISKLLESLPIQIELLTGSTKKSQRKKIDEGIQTGTTHLLIGTHALIEDTVQFNNLGFVIIDEQHRFGVAQRAKLRDKGKVAPHILVMTATPIPRTLAMTLYGDLDTSVIDELPPGRKPIKTIHLFESQRRRVVGFMKEEIEKGRQIYVVYPLIEESEKLSVNNLMEGYDALLQDFPMPQYQISIVHGQMTADKKDFEMQRFIKGITHIMIATTVIEVGVNIPNASVMVIESANRFGLSQLHQLRGRVGRGAEQSYCVLLTDHKLGKEARTRMETMVETNDGFKISEVDLQLRGPGDIEGTQQSGLLDLHIADIAKDQAILQLARETVITLFDKDPALSLPENKIIANELTERAKTKTIWSKIA
jgi:ATP-dependent DNA helicase RecG